jgi:hypothetical protein
VSVVAPAAEYSRALGRGAVVDLNEPVGKGRLRDHVDASWFEPLEGDDDGTADR